MTRPILAVASLLAMFGGLATYAAVRTELPLAGWPSDARVDGVALARTIQGVTAGAATAGAFVGVQAVVPCASPVTSMALRATAKRPTSGVAYLALPRSSTSKNAASEPALVHAVDTCVAAPRPGAT